jgi:YHS domain-containing protein
LSHFIPRNDLLTSIALLLLVFSLPGCGASATHDDSRAAPGAALSKTETGGSVSNAPQSELADPGEQVDPSVGEELGKLPPLDRASAEKQKTCPVTGALLGSMGVPYKVTVKGQTVFLCCAGCEEKLNKDPDQYLAKLKNAESK